MGADLLSLITDVAPLSHWKPQHCYVLATVGSSKTSYSRTVSRKSCPAQKIFHWWTGLDFAAPQTSKMWSGDSLENVPQSWGKEHLWASAFNIHRCLYLWFIRYGHLVNTVVLLLCTTLYRFWCIYRYNLNWGPIGAVRYRSPLSNTVEQIIFLSKNM